MINPTQKPIYISADLHARLKASAAKAGQTLRKHIEEILRRKETSK